MSSVKELVENDLIVTFWIGGAEVTCMDVEMTGFCTKSELQSQSVHKGQSSGRRKGRGGGGVQDTAIFFTFFVYFFLSAITTANTTPSFCSLITFFSVVSHRESHCALV